MNLGIESLLTVKRVSAHLSHLQETQNICITFVQCWANVEDVGPTLYKCFAFAGLALALSKDHLLSLD